MPTIQPHYLTLGELLSNRLFRIPDYQRAYSWESRQRSDLFADITKTLDVDGDREHFMATIVGLRGKNILIGTDNHKTIDIVDGQQRLTTLIVLFKAIEKNLDDAIPLEVKSAADIHHLLVKPSDGTLLLLQTNHDTTHLFRNYMTDGNFPKSSAAKTIAERHLIDAINDCENFVASWKSNRGSALSLLAAVKNRLAFIFHETEDERAVYTVFEVLNSRGLDVSWFDRLKSILMGAAFELPGNNQEEIVNELRVVWSNIYSCIGLRQGMSTEALRFAATLGCAWNPSKPIGEQDAVEQFRKGSTDAVKIRANAHWLLRVTQACDWVRSQSRMNAVTNIVHARLLITAIRLRDDISEAEKSQLSQLWEKVTFRIFGIHLRDARTRIGEYVRLSWRIVNESLSTIEIAEGLRSIGQAFPIEDGVENLRGADCYTDWQEVLRYIFFRREETLSREMGQNYSNEQWERIWMDNASESIEHIWPQSSAPESQVHSLGNLVVLPPRLNSRLGALAPAAKKPEYVKTGLLIAQEVAASFDVTWKKEQVREREDLLLAWMKEEWA